jgi:pimeloyl-ACP methyl ester carboxylesterase
MPDWLPTTRGRLAYHLTPGQGIPVAFLGGFRSDMTGTKALFLQDWARASGRPFLRFDYSGHGESDGRFEDGAIGDWLADARVALGLLDGPVTLVGSSMGGWLSLLIARDTPARVAALVTIAAAPDFTEWHFRADVDPVALARDGQVALPSDYGAPLIVTRRLIEEAAAHLVLPHALPLPMPVRFLQGTADPDVPVALAQRLLERATGPDIRLTLFKGADHRFSAPENLSLLAQTLDALPDA